MFSGLLRLEEACEDCPLLHDASQCDQQWREADARNDDCCLRRCAVLASAERQAGSNKLQHDEAEEEEPSD